MSSQAPPDYERVTDPSSPFSIDPEQLAALALSSDVAAGLSDVLRQQGVDSGDIPDRYADFSGALRGAVMANDKARLEQLIAEAGINGDAVNELMNVFEHSVSFQDLMNDPDPELVEFFATLPDSALVTTGQPFSHGQYLIPQLGNFVGVDPEKGKLRITVRPPAALRHSHEVYIPLANESPEGWIHEDSIFGSPNEAAYSQLEVFGALAARNDSVFTHYTTHPTEILRLLQSGTIGKSTLGSDHDGDIEGLWVEVGQLGQPDQYTNALSQMRVGNKPDYPVQGGRLISSFRMNSIPSFITSDYLQPGAVAPIFIFDRQVSDRRKVIPIHSSFGIVGETRFDDPSLLGIWVAPTYRNNILHWVSQWPDSKRAEVFNGWDPESLLISSAEQWHN